MRRVAASLLASFVFLALPTSGLAQRGESYPRPFDDKNPPQKATHGFPGFLDTETVPRHTVSLDFPAGMLDFGVTENTSFGINLNLLSMSLSRASLLPLFKLRHRLYSTPRLTSTVTSYLGYGRNVSLSAPFFLGGSEEWARLRSAFMTGGSLNTTSRVSEYGEASFSLSAFTTRAKQGNAGTESETQLSFGILGGSYTYNVSETFAPQLIFMTPLFISQRQETIDMVGASFWRPFSEQSVPLHLQLYLNWRMSRSVLLSPFLSVSILDGRPFILPFFTISGQWEWK